MNEYMRIYVYIYMYLFRNQLVKQSSLKPYTKCPWSHTVATSQWLKPGSR